MRLRDYNILFITRYHRFKNLDLGEGGPPIFFMGTTWGGAPMRLPLSFQRSPLYELPKPPPPFCALTFYTVWCSHSRRDPPSHDQHSALGTVRHRQISEESSKTMKGACWFSCSCTHATLARSNRRAPVCGLESHLEPAPREHVWNAPGGGSPM